MLLALALLVAPPDALTHYAAGRLQAGTGRPASAAKELEAARKADPAAAEPKRELVRVYADLGRDAAAIRLAKDVLAADPQDALTARRLGRLLADGRQFRDAATAFRQAADSPRTRPDDRPDLLRDAAKASADAGDWPAAAAALGRIDSPDGDTLERLAVALTGAKRFADADAAYRRASQVHTKAGDANRAAKLGWHRAKVLAAVGRPADAVALMEAFLALKPSTVAPYRDFADFLRAAGRGADAPNIFAKLAAACPQEPRIRWVEAAETTRQAPAAGEELFKPLLAKSADPELARLFVAAFTAAGRAEPLVAALSRPKKGDGDDDDAPLDPAAADRLRAVTAAVKADPAATALLLDAAKSAHDWPAEVWGLVGFLAERANRLPDAEAALKRGLEADPDLFHPLYQLLSRQRRWRDCVTLCNWADARRGVRWKRPPLVGYYIAGPLAELGEGQRALDALDGAIHNAKNPFGLKLQKVRVLAALDRPELALAACEDVQADAPDAATLRQVRLARSVAHLAARDWAASERELRAVLDDDPDDAEALNNLGYHLADEGRNLPEAEELVRRAVELDRAERRKRGDPETESGTYLDSLGWVLFKRGDLPGARAALEAAVRQPDESMSGVCWDHLGDVRFRQGDAAGARAAWEKADALLSDSSAGRQGGRQAEVKRKLKRVR